MFEFYRVITDSEGVKEIKKIQHDSSGLKEKLEKEIAQYEWYETVIADMYYHYDEREVTEPIELSQSVFDGDVFIGYIINNIFYAETEEKALLYNGAGGVTHYGGPLRLRKRRI